MLVLARKVGQSIIIDDNIELQVIDIQGSYVRLGIEAPKSVLVFRKELHDQIKAESAKAAEEPPLTSTEDR